MILLSLFLVFFLIGDAYNRYQFIHLSTAVSTADPAASVTGAMASGSQLRQLILPLSCIDGKWWLIHTEKFLTSPVWRIRESTQDNAPEGREVYWSSGPIWFLGAITRVVQAITGQPLNQAIETAIFFIAPLSFVFMVAVLLPVALRQFGRLAAFGQITFLTTSLGFFQYIRVGENDHHGYVAFFSLCSVSALVAGVLRWRGLSESPTRLDFGSQTDRFWFALSGLSGATALWVSSATHIPVLFGCGVAGLLMAWQSRRHATEPLPWRTWGLYGCGGSLAFYLLEYFPGHMGWRLEVNHPFWAFAWLGGGEILHRISRQFATPRPPWRWSDTLLVAAALFAAVLPIAAIVLRSEQVFWVSDKFLFLLHETYIDEFKSLPATLKDPTGRTLAIINLSWLVVLLLAAGFFLIQKRLSLILRNALVLSLAPALVMQMLAFHQIRWGGIATALWSVVVLTVLFIGSSKRSGLFVPKWASVGFCSLGLLLCLFHPLLTFVSAGLILTQSEEEKKVTPGDMGPAILARDVAHRLVTYQPERRPVILSGPSVSTELAYYGGCRMIGTLYWENMPGLKKAARMFSAATDAELFGLLQAGAVTHIVVFSWDDFADQYLSLLSKAEGRPKPLTSALADIVHETRPPPQWLRQLPYRIPAAFGMPDAWAHLYEIVPEQSKNDWLFHRGMALVEDAKYRQSKAVFQELAILDPNDARARDALVELEEVINQLPANKIPRSSP